MTFQEIQNTVLQQLGTVNALTFTRVGAAIQLRYSAILGAVGITTATKGQATASTAAGTRTVAFTGLQRLDQLYITTGLIALEAMEYDELRRLPTASAAPAAGSKYAIQTSTGSTVTVLLENTPSGITGLTADGMLDATALSGTTVPAFPAIFHDLLVTGALATEMMMRGDANSLAYEGQFEKRLLALQLFLKNTP